MERKQVFYDNDQKTYDQIVNPEEVVYKSSLGDITFPQERLIMFGRSKMMILMNIFILANFLFGAWQLLSAFSIDMTEIIGTETIDFGFFKVIFVIGLILSAIIPIAYTMIVVGSKKVDISLILKGLNIYRIYFLIGKVLLIVSAVITGVLMLVMLFRMFIFVIIFGVLMGLVFYLYFKFINKTIEVIYSLTHMLSDTKTNEVKYVPDAAGLKPYIYITIVLSIISLISNALQTETIPNTGGFTEYLNTMEQFTSITGFISLGLLIFTVIIINSFDAHMRRRRVPKI